MAGENVFKFGPQNGQAGYITRRENSDIETIKLGASVGFGRPYKIVSGVAQPIASGDAATVFEGVLVRPNIGQSADTNESFNSGTPVIGRPQAGMIKGYILVECKQGTPVKGAAVYMRVTADTGKLVGDFEAVADGANSVIVPNVTWNSDGKDANNIAEIRILK